MSNLRKYLWASVLTSGSMMGQGTLAGPSLGLVYDATGQDIRPIIGIPGASTAGKRIDTGYAITAAVIAPSHNYGLAVSADGTLNLVTFTPDGASSQPVGAAATPDLIVLSPSGAAAILYFKSAMAVQTVTGLPGSTQVSAQLDISMLPQAPDKLAISDDGSVVLAGVMESAQGQPAAGEVFTIPTDGTAPRSIAEVQHASAMTFYAQSHDVLIADDAANSITMLMDAAGQSAVQWMFADPELPGPDSVQVTLDRKTIFAGSSANGILAMVDPSGTNPTVFLSCQCAPVELRPFKPAPIYQLTEPANGLLWILDSSPMNPRVLFVPVPSDSDTSGVGSSQ